MKKIACAVALLALATVVSAEEAPAFGGGYSGFGIGKLRYTESVPGLTFDDSKIAGNVLLGYQFTPYIAIEGGYLKAATLTNSFRVGNSSLILNVDVSGFEGSLLGHLPLGATGSVFVRVGGIAYNAKASASGAGLSAFSSENGSDAIFGVGAQGNLTPAILLRGEYRFAKINDADLKMGLLSVLFRF